MAEAAPGANVLLTVTLGPVQTFIAQARRIADLWTGSHLLSLLVSKGVESLPNGYDDLVFPAVDSPTAEALPNRFVARVAGDEVEAVIERVQEAMLGEWGQILEDTIATLNRYGLAPSDPAVLTNARQAFEVSWSWVSESGGYGESAAVGAAHYKASRWFRPFEQLAEAGEKCAICGERTALPDGDRRRVRHAWEEAEKRAEKTPDERLFRFDQTRLCLVCAAKRFHALPQELQLYFKAFELFQPSEERPYYALVQMDGDHMGRVLGWGADQLLEGAEVEDFHRSISQGLHRFASQLRARRPPDLDSEGLGIEIQGDQGPQLIYAGGDDVLLVTDPRDAVPVADAIRQKYRLVMEEALGEHLSADKLRSITLSGAVLFVHTKQPAGLSLRDGARLLKRKAKQEAGRNALAIRLDKRGGVPEETVFRWGEGPAGSKTTWLEAFNSLVDDLREGRLSSAQTFNLRDEERLLSRVFKPAHWRPWLADRLSRNVATGPQEELAARIAPFFITGKSEALRIVRFLGRELASETKADPTAATPTSARDAAS